MQFTQLFYMILWINRFFKITFFKVLVTPFMINPFTTMIRYIQIRKKEARGGLKLIRVPNEYYWIFFHVADYNIAIVEYRIDTAPIGSQRDLVQGNIHCRKYLKPIGLILNKIEKEMRLFIFI